jgi:hypothetical protein
MRTHFALMANILWNVVLPGREPTSSLVVSATTASLSGALQIIREQLPTEAPAETWTFEVGSRTVTFDEFCRLANIPDAAGHFVASAPGGVARIESHPAEDR